MIIRKLTQTTPIAAQVINVQSDSTRNTYSCKYLNEHGGSGGGDSLPLGTEVCYTGDTIPVGWTDVTNERAHILWENPDPTTAMGATTITLSSCNYEVMEVFFYQRSSNNHATYSSRFLQSSSGTRLYIPSTDGNIYRTLTKSSDLVYDLSAIIGSPTSDSTLVIPLFIVGYNTIWMEDEESANYDIYSNSETVTNKRWIDGRPIYRKVISGTFASMTYQHGITGFELCDIHGTFYNSATGKSFAIPSLRPQFPGYELGVYLSDTDIIFEGGSGASWGSQMSFNLVLEYVKTADLSS